MSAAHVSLIFADKEKDKEIERLRRSVEEKNLTDILTLLFEHTKRKEEKVLESFIEQSFLNKVNNYDFKDKIPKNERIKCLEKTTNLHALSINKFKMLITAKIKKIVFSG